MSSTRNANLTNNLCGAGFAFFGFAVAPIIGLVADNGFVTIILRGLAVLVLFYILGLALATVGHKAVEENFQAQADVVRAEENATAEQEAQSEEENEAEESKTENRASPAESLVQT